MRASVYFKKKYLSTSTCSTWWRQSALRFHNVSEETKKKFIELFKNDHSAASAYQDYKNHLIREHGNHFVKISAYSAIMPDYKWVFSFHSIFIKEQFGKINSPEAYEEAVAKVKNIMINMRTFCAQLNNLMMEKLL